MGEWICTRNVAECACGMLLFVFEGRLAGGRELGAWAWALGLGPFWLWAYGNQRRQGRLGLARVLRMAGREMDWLTGRAHYSPSRLIIWQDGQNEQHHGSLR